MKWLMNDQDTQRLLGALEEFVKIQKEVNTKTDNFLSNHWPHMVADIASMKMWMKGMSAVVTLVGSVIAGAALKIIFFS